VPYRALVAKELAELLGVLSHPHRVRIIEELRNGERDVKTLQVALGISHPGVSQHLMILRAHRLVSERRQGRHVYYHLRQPELAAWLSEAMNFLEEERAEAEQLRNAIEKTRVAWSTESDATE
jgi:DNA-binding transcriptional ArsR family regulator